MAKLFNSITEAIDNQINVVTIDAYNRERFMMMHEGHELPSDEELPEYITVLKKRVINTLIQSN